MKHKIMLLFLLLLTAACLSLIKACYFEDEERDRIKFMDSFDVVQFNIIKLDSVMEVANKKCGANYVISFQGDNLLIMNHNAGDDALKPGYFCSSAEISHSAFNNIVKVLKRNSITSCYSSSDSSFKVFGYHEEFSDFVMMRQIVIDKKNNKEKVTQTRNNILDIKGRLILIHPLQL